jgi:hypothetical protein
MLSLNVKSENCPDQPENGYNALKLAERSESFGENQQKKSGFRLKPLSQNMGTNRTIAAISDRSAFS